MKKITFKLKMTIFTAIIISAVCIFTFAALIISGNSAAQATAKQTLTTFIAQNAGKPEYINGILTLGDDFIFFSNGIYCDVYSDSFEYIAGQTPHALIDFEEFENERLLKREIASEEYYNYDMRLDFTLYTYEIDASSGNVISYNVETMLTDKKAESGDNVNTEFSSGINTAKATEIAIVHSGVNPENVSVLSSDIILKGNNIAFKICFSVTDPVLPCIWIRGTTPCDNITQASSPVYKGFLYIAPLLIILSAASAYFISEKTINPIKKINDSALRISTGGDLSERIDIGNGNDEIHKLARTFNSMLSQLDRSFKSEKQFTSDASHELRTPLSVIKAECDFALSKYSTDADKTEALMSINEQTDKMTSLVSALLTLTRIEQRTEAYRFENTDMSELVKQVCEQFKCNKGIALTCEVETEIYLKANASLIGLMLQNLLSNAEKYGKENGYIKVVLNKDENCVHLKVKDNGIGIKPDDLEKIWDRFFRADSSRSGSEGFGLGLSIVKKIVNAHSGTINISSVYGEGTEFDIVFPVQA